MSDDLIALSEVEWSLAWHVRGDPARTPFTIEAERVLGVALPGPPNTTAYREGKTALWLGPGSSLVVATADAMPVDFDAARVALNARGGALFDVSAGYVAWKISGSNAAGILNRSCPLDFHSRVFLPASCAQSVLGHVNALFYRPGEKPEFIVVVGLSLALDAWHTLCRSAETDGYRLGERAAFTPPDG